MFRFLLACVGLLVFFGTAAQAQGWTVARLKVAGAEVPGTTVELREPGGGMQPRELRVQQTLAPGTELKARAEVEIELQSPGRMRAMKEAGDEGTLVLAAVSSAGERVEVKAGLWGFKRLSQAVGQALSPFSASAGSGTASTRGTEFTVAVDEQGGFARFAVQEGRVQMNWPEQVEVQATGTPQGPATSARRTVRRVLRAGDPAVTVPLNPSGWLMRYTDYNDALSAFASQLREAEARQDPDAVFEALLAQADMLVLAGRPQEALAPLQRAQDRVNGPGTDDTYWRAVAIGRRGGALQALNRYGEAALAFVEARNLHAQVPAREGERTGVEQSGNIASNLLADGAVRCADTWAARLLAELDAEQAGPARHIRAPLMGIRGDAAAALQQPDQARRWHDQALEMQKDADLAKRDTAGRIASPEVARAMIALGLDETVLRSFADAERLHTGALTMVEGLFAAPHPLKADARLGQAYLQLVRQRPAESLALTGQALAQLDALPPDAVRRADVLTLRGQALLAASRAAQAVVALREARDLLTPIWPDASHPRFQPLLADLARALRASGAPAAEAQAVEQAARQGQEALVWKEAACPR